jgi:hypothetical protein
MAAIVLLNLLKSNCHNKNYFFFFKQPFAYTINTFTLNGVILLAASQASRPDRVLLLPDFHKSVKKSLLEVLASGLYH